MEQHAIPQQISSYQFRLVGDMTLKQFFQLAGGALISLLFYASPLHPLIKWPFVIFFGLLGVALAFLPFEERPLEKWIAAFFRSIYSPTLFSWQKAQAPSTFFQEEAAPGIGLTPQAQPVAPAPPRFGGAIFSKLESAEQTFLSSVSQIFGTMPQLAAPVTMPSGPVDKGPMQVPFSAPVPVVGLGPRIVVEEKPAPPPQTPTVTTTPVAQTVIGQSISGRQAQYSMSAAPPNPPTVPNTIVGQIFDTEGKIVSGAILEIRDAAGRPVRALKSNMLGHFIIVTPLSDGTYEIIAEKEGLNFDTLSFEAKGEIIPPIAIKARSPQKILTTEELVSSKQVAQL